jgi:hypothetical protein
VKAVDVSNMEISSFFANLIVASDNLHDCCRWREMELDKTLIACNQNNITTQLEVAH